MAPAFHEMSKLGRGAVIGGLCAAIALLFHYFYYAGTAQRARTLRAQIAEVQRDNEGNREVAVRHPELEAEVAAMEARLSELSHLLPATPQTDVLLRRLNTAAADANLNLRSFHNQPVVLHDFYAEVSIQLDLVGNFYDLAMFFDRVGRFGRAVTVRRITIRAATDGGPGTIQSQVTATSFYLLPAADIVDAAAAARTGGLNAAHR